MNKKITRDDVAKLAGVSPAVVSYVINQTKFVSEEKTQAVRRAIEELQYRPNLHARSLKTNKSMQIAFVCDNLRNNWLEIAEQKFFDRGYVHAVQPLYGRPAESDCRGRNPGSALQDQGLQLPGEQYCDCGS